MGNLSSCKWAMAALFILVVDIPAHADFLTGISSSGTLLDIDPVTGAATNQRTTGLSAVVGIALSPNNVLYALTPITTTLNGQNAASSLVRINPTTGLATLVGPTGFDIIGGDLAFDPTSGVLYGMQASNIGLPAESLITINPNTGSGSFVGGIPEPGNGSNYSAMTFDAAGNLYMIDDLNNLLVTVNKSTGAIISSIRITGDFSSFGGPTPVGMTFAPNSGQLFVSSSGLLLTLDPNTGVDRIVSSGLPRVAGMTAAVPEPSTVLSLSIGILCLLGFTWRHRRRGRVMFRKLAA